MIMRRICLVIVALIFICGCGYADKKVCKEKNDFIYTYTPCINNSRWRVAVPGKECRGGSITAPLKPSKCEFRCQSGQRVDPKKLSEKCEDCPGGTYSIRGGMRFDDWEDLPSGFTTAGERGANPDSSGLNCTGYTWKPAGSYLGSPSGSPCSALLRYTVHMAKEGTMTITYKYTETSESMFTVEVQNDQCQVNMDSEHNWILGTKASGWGSHNVKLGKGRNRIFIIFMDSTSNDKDSATPTAMIRDIEFHGVARIQHCTKCRAGTHSTKAATKCTPCSADTYSKRGAQECIRCPDNKFSLPGSDGCKDRPVCKESDYYFSWGPCNNSTGKMVKIYDWIYPKVCKGGVKLPTASSEFKSCADNICNAGSYRVNATSCAACPPGKVPKPNQNLAVGMKNNSGQSSEDGCMTCPVNSQPVYSIRYTKWWNMPPLMETICVSLGIQDSTVCPASGQWIPMGSYIRSGYGSGTWFSILELVASGFVGGSQEFTGQMSFEFQLHCAHKCKLYLMMESDDKGHFVVRDWDGSVTGRQKFSYALRHEGETKFMWIFERPALRKTIERKNNDFAAIYSVFVTHTKDTSAVECETCPMNAAKQCIPCPNGQYYSSKSKKCMSCPLNHVVWRTPARSVDDCRECGVGMRPHNGNSCVIDLSLSTLFQGGQKKHNLSQLTGNQTITGSHLFTTGGLEYHHVFTFTIDNSLPTDQLPMCASNLTTFGSDEDASETPLKHRLVRTLVCQYTMVPPRKKNGHYLTAQPVSLGDRLVNITSTNHTPEHYEYINKRFDDAGWMRDEDNLDLHLFYVTAEPSQACPSGRTTLLTLRCDPKSFTDKGKVYLPPKCQDGTCDGCNFHFLWKTRLSCPVCDRSDYEVVKSECIGGRQKIHYYPAKYCYFSTKDKHVKVVEVIHCPLLSSTAEIAIIVIVVVGIFLVTMLGYCWKRNRRLEYKYMKLVEGQGSRPGELPQAESCAVHEGEEEDDDVHIKSGGGTSSAFFSRFKQFRKTRTIGGDRMETVNLTDRDEFGL